MVPGFKIHLINPWTILSPLSPKIFWQGFLKWQFNLSIKSSEDIVSKSCWAWRNITLEQGWRPISSPAILIRQAPFWPADMHTVHAREWHKRLKLVMQPVWLVQTPGQLIVHTQHDFDTISSEVFLFAPFFTYQEKPLVSEYKFYYTWFTNELHCIPHQKSQIWWSVWTFYRFYISKIT